MGTVVYCNLVELLLEEGDKTKEEIINQSLERFGFSKDKLSFEVGLQLTMGEKTGFFSRDKDGKYHLLKYHDGMFGREHFLGTLNESDEEYFRRNPSIKKLKQALEQTGR